MLLDNLIGREYNSYGLPVFEEQQTERELFHSFIDSINNAIGNHVRYNLNDEKERNECIENFLEEFIFCLHNDETFKVIMLNIPKEFTLSKKDGFLFCSVFGGEPRPISEQNRKEASKIYRNPQNGAACFYKFSPREDIEPLFMLNFAYSDKKEEKEISLYKKVILDYIELKEIQTMEDIRKTIIACFKTYKKNNPT